MRHVSHSDPISIARAVVHRVDGRTEVYYAYDKPNPWDLKRWYKLLKHLRFMKREDRHG